ncbi:hypothetical protein PHSC3_001502 [Chlamydiales bacterium STE3]|nr:hypothetical protein PHSC3_001502 [Chlamydiales bacterium STE3]
MSPKNSSLAYEEKEQIFSDLEIDYLPELNLLVKVRPGFESEGYPEEAVKISGCLTVSF